MRKTTFLRVVILSWLPVLCAVSVSAQPRGQGRQGRGGVLGAPDADAPGPSPAEVQKMFDAYALMQAQEQLKISDDQFGQFLTRYKALQDARRKSLQDHTRLIMEMRRLLNQPEPDDAQLKERMKALQDLEARSGGEIKKAYEAVDQVLDVRQQAKFRVFEELIERRKLELVNRARQANRPKNQQ